MPKCKPVSQYIHHCRKISEMIAERFLIEFEYTEIDAALYMMGGCCYDEAFELAKSTVTGGCLSSIVEELQLLAAITDTHGEGDEK